MSCSAMEPRMEVLSLFPRHLLKGELPGPLLSDLQQLAHSVRAEPGVAPDASVKLAGQLALQRGAGAPVSAGGGALCPGAAAGL